ncbi:undecaprenyldiphospho-muramoylpentapeptide beta-N-acetylglucosaminyltransferase [Thiotrichales bacterium 19S9-12]|nr:undecaprenyldiphospho-muramoylpentapeptide beta-N-acetylglucosaminyltransferase [Thiotrichales bacterium 19S9-11]MCF6811145.1 undecaprenyldiphospho-muramoylpentapeptide beta-N-acetylglucosaminyltransferase [Thiotrichales bacterium 19S9-12]
MKNDVNKLYHKRIMILAGGTGGHIFPALTVAKALERQGANIFWLGTNKGLEKKIIEGTYPISYMSMTGIRNKGIKRLLLMPWILLKSVYQAYKILKKNKIDLVLGFGGYVAAPGGIAAKLYFKPLIIHEQNAKSGLTNRLLSKIANMTFSAFTKDRLSKKTKIIGNPIRDEILNLYQQEKELPNGRVRRILVTGGSQGARSLNQIVPQTLNVLAEKFQFEVYHQSGHLDLKETVKAYEGAPYQVNVVAFIDQVSEAYQWADMIICRSGALTVSEVSACGLPAIFIPYPHAVDDHQYYNAKSLVESHLAKCIRQEDLTVNTLSDALREWLNNENQLMQLPQKIKSAATVDATDKIIDACSRFL